MPFTETCRMEERIRMLSDYETGNWSVTELCRRYGVCRDTFYEWRKRRDSGGRRCCISEGHCCGSDRRWAGQWWRGERWFGRDRWFCSACGGREGRYRGGGSTHAGDRGRHGHGSWRRCGDWSGRRKRGAQTLTITLFEVCEMSPGKNF